LRLKTYCFCIHHRGAESAKDLFFSFAAERAANENPQPLRGGIYISLSLFLVSLNLPKITLPEGRLFFTFWPLTKK
jgi:hypothetical protein